MSGHLDGELTFDNGLEDWKVLTAILTMSVVESLFNLTQ